MSPVEAVSEFVQSIVPEGDTPKWFTKWLVRILDAGAALVAVACVGFTLFYIKENSDSNKQTNATIIELTSKVAVWGAQMNHLSEAVKSNTTAVKKLAENDISELRLSMMALNSELTMLRRVEILPEARERMESVEQKIDAMQHRFDALPADIQRQLASTKEDIMREFAMLRQECAKPKVDVQ